MANQSGLLNRQDGRADARLAIVGDTMPASGAAVARAADQGGSIWDAKIVFLLVASAFNAGTWWGIATLIFGGAWTTPVLVFTFAIWLLTLFALSISMAASDR